MPLPRVHARELLGDDRQQVVHRTARPTTLGQPVGPAFEQIPRPCVGYDPLRCAERRTPAGHEIHQQRGCASIGHRHIGADHRHTLVDLVAHQRLDAADVVSERDGQRVTGALNGRPVAAVPQRQTDAGVGEPVAGRHVAVTGRDDFGDRGGSVESGLHIIHLHALHGDRPVVAVCEGHRHRSCGPSESLGHRHLHCFESGHASGMASRRPSHRHGS